MANQDLSRLGHAHLINILARFNVKCLSVLIAQCQRYPTLAKWAWHVPRRGVAWLGCIMLPQSLKYFVCKHARGLPAWLRSCTCCLYRYLQQPLFPVTVVVAVPHTNRHTRTWLICLANNGPKSLTIDRFGGDSQLPRRLRRCLCLCHCLCL